MKRSLCVRSLVVGVSLSGATCGLWADDSPAAKPTAEAKQAAAAKPGAEAKPAAEGKPDAAPEPFAKVHAEWQAVEKKLDELIDQFRKAPAPAERDALRKKYLALIEDAKNVVPRLRKSAQAAYLADPNKDAEVVRVLVGILANDVRSDDNESALTLAKLLIDNKAPEEAIWGLAGTAAFSADRFDEAEQYFKTAVGKGGLEPPADAYFDKIEDFKAAWKKEQEIRAAEAKANDLPRVKLTTNKGVIVIELFENEAPKAVGNFVSLVEKRYYDGLTFHRVLPNFMAQGGCPKGDGTGGPGYNIPCACSQENYRHHFAGTLSMAHAGANTGGSQFFITFRPTPHLDGRHTAFGRVIEGMDVLVKIQRRDPQRNPVDPDKILKAEVLRKRDHEYAPTKVGAK